MPDVLDSALDVRSDAYRQQRDVNLGLLAQIEAELSRAAAGGGEKYVTRHRERGRLLARERIELLVDRDAPFLELMPLAGWGTSDPLGGALVVGIGPVEGVECLITAHDPTI
ncbi:MAG TPA: carboxyl transferase domain-containing protein, partial [Acidimicrobiia bacterium]|nr:carboxyl transferase domain-containing protein [Acidimicrobiia bacterium]